MDILQQIMMHGGWAEAQLPTEPQTHRTWEIIMGYYGNIVFYDEDNAAINQKRIHIIINTEQKGGGANYQPVIEAIDGEQR